MDFFEIVSRLFDAIAWLFKSDDAREDQRLATVRDIWYSAILVVGAIVVVVAGIAYFAIPHS